VHIKEISNVCLTFSDALVVADTKTLQRSKAQQKRPVLSARPVHVVY
jgi:hypothetical protein